MTLSTPPRNEKGGADIGAALITGVGPRAFDYGVWCLRRANTSANAPATNDDSPMIGPESELPVNGSAPVVEPGVVAAAVTTLEVVGDVEPRLPNPVVVGVVRTVEPSVSIGVLDTVVVDGSVVVDAPSMVVLVVLVVAAVVEVVASVVLVVASVVVVVVSGPHAELSDTEADWSSA